MSENFVALYAPCPSGFQKAWKATLWLISDPKEAWEHFGIFWNAVFDWGRTAVEVATDVQRSMRMIGLSAALELHGGL